MKVPEATIAVGVPAEPWGSKRISRPPLVSTATQALVDVHATWLSCVEASIVTGEPAGAAGSNVSWPPETFVAVHCPADGQAIAVNPLPPLA